METSTYNRLTTSHITNISSYSSSLEPSELRKIYTTIQAISKESPVYLPDYSQNKQTYTLAIKDASINLHNFLTNLLDDTCSLKEKNSECSLLPEQEFIDLYNKLHDIATSHTHNERRAHKLIYELNHIIVPCLANLNACGIIKTESDTLQYDNAHVPSSDNINSLKKLLTNNEKLSTKLLSQTMQIAINPMDYVDQKICTYPNIKSQKFPAPYITSIYTGMLFNTYC